VQRRVYFDGASTTAVHPDVLQTYKSLLDKYYVNSESLYDEGSEISRMMEKARSAIAGLLGVNSEDIIFTSGSSEANSSAIKGVCFAQPGKKHIVTTNVEHSSILNACLQMERVFGYRVTYLPVDASGKVSLQQVKDAVNDDTAIVSIMAVNNEVGSIKAIGKVDVDFKNIDLASISAHKLEGLKGSGVLVKKVHVPFVPLINGGEQEYGIRGGTSNACVNMVFAKTLRFALENGKKYHDYITTLQQALLKGLSTIPGVLMNQPSDAVNSVVNFSYEKIPSEVMQNALNKKGFMVSARSTCASKSDDPSYVLSAMGYSSKRASSCIRISLTFIDSLKEIISQYG